MSTLDVRSPTETKNIQFDDSEDRLEAGGTTISFYADSAETNVELCDYKDLDTFITALRKAKELWGPKE